ncbi:putative hydrolase protein [Pestalotiopsis sp. NC0098]|nr:putative hydrolase protein [Pestalotiopsis sp. NC0098]
MASTSTTKPNVPAHYGPSETALLLLDFHNIILGTIPVEAEKEKLVRSTQALLEAARASKAPVLHCLIGTSRNPMPTSKLVERWEDSFQPAIAASPDLALQISSLAGDAGSGHEYFFDRVPGRVSALQSKGLTALLKEKLGVKSLVLAGVVSSGCVLSTARGAADEDFVVTVVPDACWDREAEVHRAVMDKIIPMTGHTASVEEAVGLLRGTGSGSA